MNITVGEAALFALQIQRLFRRRALQFRTREALQRAARHAGVMRLLESFIVTAAMARRIKRMKRSVQRLCSWWHALAFRKRMRQYKAAVRFSTSSTLSSLAMLAAFVVVSLTCQWPEVWFQLAL